MVRFAGAGILLVEVKIRGLDQAGGRDNLLLYLKWLDEEAGDIECRKAVLLLPTTEESVSADWTIRTWGQLTQALRRIAVELYAAGPAGLMHAAVMLAFAGAVEENLLGLSGLASGASVPQTTLHLERFLQRHDQ